LGQNVTHQTLELLELLLGASKLPVGTEKTQLLHNANSKLELIKILVRMSFEVKAISDKQYLALQSSLQELGKMLGGWMRSINR